MIDKVNYIKEKRKKDPYVRTFKMAQYSRPQECARR